jgi:hypothetical protein
MTPILKKVNVGAELEKSALDLRSMIAKAKTIIDDSDGDDSDLESDAGTKPTDTKALLDEIASDVKFYDLRLMDLLPSIERTALQLKVIPGPKNALTAIPSVKFQVSQPAHAYVLQIWDKYPDADERLIERLGEANWQRRVRIREDPHDTIESTAADTAKSVFIPVSMFHDSGLGSSFPTQSGYAPTAVSHSSFQTSVTESRAGCYKVPSTPQEVAAGKPFTCKLCHHTLRNVKNRLDWKYDQLFNWTKQELILLGFMFSPT